MNYKLQAQLDQTTASLREAYTAVNVDVNDPLHRAAIAMTLVLLADATPQKEEAAHTLYGVFACFLGDKH
jgi:hypothetical protein